MRTIFTKTLLIMLALSFISVAVHAADKKINPSEMMETYVGDEVADAMKAAMKTDIALINGGSLGYESLPAKLSKETLPYIVPFATDNIIAVTISGADLLAALEKSASLLPRRSTSFLQVSGITMIIDLNLPSGKRLVTVRVNGSPLKMGQNYSLAITDFLASGGGGLKSLRSATVIEGAVPKVLADVIMGSMNYNSKKVGDPEGRILIVAPEGK